MSEVAPRHAKPVYRGRMSDTTTKDPSHTLLAEVKAVGRAVSDGMEAAGAKYGMSGPEFISNLVTLAIHGTLAYRAARRGDTARAVFWTGAVITRSIDNGVDKIVTATGRGRVYPTSL